MYKLVTVKDYFKYCISQQGDKVISVPPNIADSIPCLKWYSDNYDDIGIYLDELYKEKYANLQLINSVVTDDKTIYDLAIIALNNIVFVQCERWKYKWNTLWKTLELKYNPIWNVEGTEETVTTHGAQTDTRDYGAHTTTNDYGAHTTTNDFGEKTTTNTEKGFTFPYDSQEKTQTAENVIQSTIPKNTDTTTESARSDSVKVSQRVDTVKTNEYIDKIKHTRSGNIGVTTTQKMIAEERNIAMFAFWDVVYKDIIDAISIPYFVEE